MGLCLYMIRERDHILLCPIRFIFSVIWFSIYLVLWIWSLGPAYFKLVNLTVEMMELDLVPWPNKKDRNGLGGKYSLKRVFTWMRKVVGSNPGDNLYRMYVFFCGCGKYEIIDWRRLLRDRKIGTAGNDTMRWGNKANTRGGSNQPSLRSGAIYRSIVIYKWWRW